MDFWNHLDAAAKRSAAYSERHFVLFGLLIWTVPLAWVVDEVVGEPYYNTFPVRLSVAIAGVPLLLSKSLPKRVEDLFHIYFVCLVAYTFPFCFGLMLVMNAAFCPPETQIHMLWIFQYFIALFLFIQLINHGTLTVILWTASTMLALSPVLILEDINWSELRRVLVYPVTGYLTALVFGILTNRNIDIVNAEKIKTASAIGSNIAHELRTPLASVRSLASGLKKYLPVLIDGYHQAKAQNLPVEPIRPGQLEQIEKVLSSIVAEVEYSNTVIDMLLINTADKPLSGLEYDTFTATGCVNEAVGRYPFNNTNEKKLIHLELAEDFEIHAPRLLVVHVLFNLIKNALYYVQRAGRGDIRIRTEAGAAANRIRVHDTGAGIPAAVQKQMFERFFTTTQTGQGAGIGLSFCKMVMESIGGRIECDSVEGDHTTFTLTFPTAR